MLAGFKCWKINPTSDLMALQRGVEDRELPKSIDELRILGQAARCADRSIEPPEDLLECVIVAFAMAAWKIGIAARRGL